MRKFEHRYRGDLGSLSRGIDKVGRSIIKYGLKGVLEWPGWGGRVWLARGLLCGRKKPRKKVLAGEHLDGGISLGGQG